MYCHPSGKNLGSRQVEGQLGQIEPPLFDHRLVAFDAVPVQKCLDVVTRGSSPDVRRSHAEKRQDAGYPNGFDVLHHRERFQHGTSRTVIAG